MSPDYLIELADACILAGELAEALDALNQYLAVTPDDPHALRLRAAVLLRMPDDAHWRAALADFDVLTALTPDEHIQRSLIFERLGAIDQALEAVKQGRDEYPLHERLLERYFHLLVAHGSFADIEAALANLPQDDWCWQQWAGDLAVRVGDDARAAEHYTAALAELDARPTLRHDGHRIAIQARLLLALGDTYLRQGLLDRAEDCWTRVAQLVPNDPMIPFNRGLLAALRGDLTEALALCGEALTRTNETLAVYMEQTLRGDSRFAALAALLLMGDADG